jgi:hypothetical protein
VKRVALRGCEMVAEKAALLVVLKAEGTVSQMADYLGVWQVETMAASLDALKAVVLAEQKAGSTVSMMVVRWVDLKVVEKVVSMAVNLVFELVAASVALSADSLESTSVFAMVEQMVAVMAE